MYAFTGRKNINDQFIFRWLFFIVINETSSVHLLTLILTEYSTIAMTITANLLLEKIWSYLKGLLKAQNLSMDIVKTRSMEVNARKWLRKAWNWQTEVPPTPQKPCQ